MSEKSRIFSVISYLAVACCLVACFACANHGPSEITSGPMCLHRCIAPVAFPPVVRCFCPGWLCKLGLPQQLPAAPPPPCVCNMRFHASRSQTRGCCRFLPAGAPQHPAHPFVISLTRDWCPGENWSAIPPLITQPAGVEKCIPPCWCLLYVCGHGHTKFIACAMGVIS